MHGKIPGTGWGLIGDFLFLFGSPYLGRWWRMRHLTPTLRRWWLVGLPGTGTNRSIVMTFLDTILPLVWIASASKAAASITCC